jgi:hypothetical protein
VIEKQNGAHKKNIARVSSDGPNRTCFDNKQSGARKDNGSVIQRSFSNLFWPIVMKMLF